MPISKLRDKGYETAAMDYVKKGKITKSNALAGHPKGSAAARVEMEQVCKSCHVSTHTKNFFKWLICI